MFCEYVYVCVSVAILSSLESLILSFFFIATKYKVPGFIYLEGYLNQNH